MLNHNGVTSQGQKPPGPRPELSEWEIDTYLPRRLFQLCIKSVCFAQTWQPFISWDLGVSHPVSLQKVVIVPTYIKWFCFGF